MDRFLQDLKYAFRLLIKDRGFTVTTVATLALGLAANTAIFTIVRSVLLKPLPFPESSRIVTMHNSYPGAGAERGGTGVADYYDRLRETYAFEEIALYRTTGVTRGGAGQGEVERVTRMIVTPSFFRLLRTAPLRGRLFTEQEAEVGQHLAAALTYGAWQKHFGGRDEAVGEDIRLNGVLHRVMGVLPPDFLFLDPDVALFTPAAFTPDDRSDDQRHSNNWEMIARLRPGATLALARSQIDALNARNLERFPSLKEVLINARFGTLVDGFQGDLVAESRPTLLLLWGGVLLVLAVACVNVANLVAVRGAARARELSLRYALGAGTGRIARQLVSESFLISLAGGIAGLTLGQWGLEAAQRLGLDDLPRGSEIRLDAGVLAYTFGLVSLVGVVVGLLPLLSLRRANLAQVLRDEGRTGTVSGATRFTRRVLVASQVAFALVLLVGAGLLLASFDRLLAVDPGFRPSQVLTGTVSLPASRYAVDGDLRSAVERTLAGVRALPGVETAGATTVIPLGGSYDDSVIVAEGYQMQPGESFIAPNRVVATDGYFQAMGMTLVRGRFFDASDTERTSGVVIVDEWLARKFWPGADPIGQRMYRPTISEDRLAPPPDDEWLTVAGVVKDVRLRDLAGGGKTGLYGTYYLSYRQAPERTVTLAVRSHQSPTLATNAVRAAIATVDPELPFFSVRTMDERIDRSLTNRRTPMVLGLGFAVTALFLAAIGVYGMLAHQVGERRREIGIRMALGADRSSIFSMVLREGTAVVLAGALVGVGGAFLLRRTLESQLYGVGVADPRVLGGVAALLFAVALIAGWLPARRAARTDPAIALADQ